MLARREGQGLVEFAMIVPLFLLVIVGILEFGFLFDQAMTLNYATREGARGGAAFAAGNSSMPCADVDENIVAAVQRVLDSPGLAGHDVRGLADPHLPGDVERARTRARAGRWTYAAGGGPVIVSGEPALDFRYSSGSWDACGRDNTWTNGVAPDSVGVSITYRYHLVTPLASIMGFFGGGGPGVDHDLGPHDHGPQPDQPVRDRMRLRPRPGRATGPRPRVRARSSPIFAGAMLLFVLLAATVIDLSWYWTNNLRMQRAADAAALAGVIFLPGREDLAISRRPRRGDQERVHQRGRRVHRHARSRTPATRAGSRSTSAGRWARTSPRVLGMASFPASRDAKADYVLPVPMGSPENYYGVGFYEGRVAQANGDARQHRLERHRAGRSAAASGRTPTGPRPTTTRTRPRTPTARSSSGPTSSCRREIPNDGTLVIDGIRVRLQDARLTGSGTSTDCHVDVGLSWNGGSSWSDWVVQRRRSGRATPDPVVGTNSDLSMWSPHTSWSRGEFANGTFRVRLRWVGRHRRLRLDAAASSSTSSRSTSSTTRRSRRGSTRSSASPTR